MRGDPLSDNTTHLSCLYARNPDVVVKEEDEDGALVFNPDTDRILVLNPTGFFIWQQCDGSRTLAEIVQTVADNFTDIPHDEMENQVTTYVSEMVSAGFIGMVEE